MRFQRGKYNVSPANQSRWNGRTYGSKAEMLRAQHWYALMEVGQILELVEQPGLWLGVPENKYRPDFLVIRCDGLHFYEDVKGMETAKFRRDKKLWASYGRLPLWVTKRKGSGFEVVEVVEPRRAGCTP